MFRNPAMLLSDNGICGIQKENIDLKFTIQLSRINNCKVKSKLWRVFFIAPKILRGAVLASAKTEKSRAQYSEIYCSTTITPFNSTQKFERCKPDLKQKKVEPVSRDILLSSPLQLQTKAKTITQQWLLTSWEVGIRNP